MLQYLVGWNRHSCVGFYGNRCSVKHVTHGELRTSPPKPPRPPARPCALQHCHLCVDWPRETRPPPCPHAAAGILWLEMCVFSAFSRATRLLSSTRGREVQCSTTEEPISPRLPVLRVAHSVLSGGLLAPPNSCSDGHFGSTLIEQLASILCGHEKCAGAPCNANATSKIIASFIARLHLNLIVCAAQDD